MKNPIWPRYRTRIMHKKEKMAYYLFIFRTIVGLTSPVIQNTFSPKKGIPLS